MMMVVVMPLPINVVIVVMMMVVVIVVTWGGDHDLRELESLLLLRPKRVDGVRNGSKQFRVGPRWLQHAPVARGGSGG